MTTAHPSKKLTVAAPSILPANLTDLPIYLSLNHYAKTAITNLIYNKNNLSVTWINVGILLITGVSLARIVHIHAPNTVQTNENSNIISKRSAI